MELDVYMFIDSIFDGIYVTDKRGIVISVNKRFTELTTIEANEVIGKSMEKVWDQKNFSDYNENVFFVMDSKDHLSLLTMMDKNMKNIKKSTVLRKPLPIGLIVLKEKKKICVIATLAITGKTVLIVGTPFYDKKGEISHVVTIIRDLTELAGLKEKLKEVESEKKKYANEIECLKKNELNNDLIGISDAMLKVKKLINSVSKTDATVLITGATGVGKEVVAREIFKNSKRGQAPYIKVNCAAIPDTLLESELFGYEKGAFTGAQNKEKKGLFEMAHKGTILLDEIGEMPLQLQPKLLRVLQEKEIRRVGGSNYINVDVRVIAATNENLEEQIEKRKFREDLYYRLNVIPIEIPPLNQRKEDIIILAEKFLKKFNIKHDKNKHFEKNIFELLEAYEWPGNVRELENLVERLVVIGENNEIKKGDIVAILGTDKIRFSYTNNSNTTLKEAVN